MMFYQVNQSPTYHEDCHEFTAKGVASAGVVLPPNSASSMPTSSPTAGRKPLVTPSGRGLNSSKLGLAHLKLGLAREIMSNEFDSSGKFSSWVKQIDTPLAVFFLFQLNKWLCFGFGSPFGINSWHSLGCRHTRLSNNSIIIYLVYYSTILEMSTPPPG